MIYSTDRADTALCISCATTHRQALSSIFRCWDANLNVALLGPPTETQSSRQREKNNKTDELSATFFFRSKLSKFRITLGPQLIKTSPCRVGTQNKQARSPCSVPTHNLIKDMRIMQCPEPAIENTRVLHISQR